MSQSTIERRPPRAQERARCCWIKAATLLSVICALTLALATRFTDYPRPGRHSTRLITQPDHETRRQHIDKGSFTWTLALPSSIRPLLFPARARGVSFTPSFVELSYQVDTYDRPPPASLKFRARMGR